MDKLREEDSEARLEKNSALCPLVLLRNINAELNTFLEFINVLGYKSTPLNCWQTLMKRNLHFDEN